MLVRDLSIILAFEPFPESSAFFRVAVIPSCLPASGLASTTFSRWILLRLTAGYKLSASARTRSCSGPCVVFIGTDVLELST